MKSSKFLSLLLFQVFANYALAAGVSCAGTDVSGLTRPIYVSPQGSDGISCGQNTTSPCKTIQQGITNCVGAECIVLVRYGVYNVASPLQLADGVSLYGSCIFDETPFRYRSTIVGRPAIRANGIKTATTIYGFVILGSSGVSAAEASLAVVVSNSSGLIFSRNVLASGRGGTGGNGSTPFAYGGNSGRYAPNANTGGAGGVACYTNPPGSVGQGGKGADYQQLYSTGGLTRLGCSNNNYPASLGQPGQASGSFAGGDGGGRGSAGCACSGGGDNAGAGPAGQPGKTGASGKQGGTPNTDSKGTFAGTIWRPGVGGTGASGEVGSGGGGGGSGGYGVLPGEDFPGFPGGGGGGGGCGGPGGVGAQQGGASIPLVLFASSIAGLTDGNLIIPGPGGRGGTGGTGARGGSGGGGATGYLGHQYNVTKGLNGIVCKGLVPGQGGKGGTGGQGGAGSGGAGGNGGPSFGIALVNSSSFSPNGITIYPAQPGEGGQLGAAGQNDAQNKGTDGKAGLPGFSDNGNSIVSFSSAVQPIGASQ